MVPPGDQRLMDRTGHARLGTTDPVAGAIWLDARLAPPLLDRVLLHEAAHAAMASGGPAPAGDPDEWGAQLIEAHAIEAVAAASAALGRPVCVDGTCMRATRT